MDDCAVESPLKRTKLDSEELDQSTEDIQEMVEDDTSLIRNEKLVAITEYIGNHKGFRGIFKKRYSDFVVHEIDKDDQVIQLTDISDPVSRLAKPKCDNIDSNIQQKLENLVNGLDGDQLKIDVSEYDKISRTAIHVYVRNNLTDFDSETTQEEDKKFIIVKSKKTIGTTKHQSRSHWPDLPPYVHFTVYHENRGTIEVVNTLSKILNIKSKHFQYAGTKDKRSVSTQRMSIHKVLPEKLLIVNKLLMMKERPITVGNFSFEKTPLKLGQLSGNKFDIVLRELEYDTFETLQEAFNAVTNSGFINYYGTQRFGSHSVPTHLIGLDMLKKDWKSAVEKILVTRSPDRKSPAPNGLSFNDCIKLWKETNDATTVYNKFYWKHSLEGYILENLKKSGLSNYNAALSSLSRNSRMIYMHAYQSIIWNKLASFRFKKYGLKVVIGDLVMRPNSKDLNDTTDFKLIPTLVNDKNINDYSIYDVVLSTPGSNIRLPENLIKDELFRLLKEDDISLDNFKNVSKSNMIEGNYRKFVIKPNILSWNILSYSGNENLIITDIESFKLRNISNNSIEEKHCKALLVSVILPTSSYATIFIRELLKSDLNLG